jgi:hypothetical protein
MLKPKSASFYQEDAAFSRIGLKNRGQPLQGAHLVGVKGDWSFEKEAFRQKRAWSHNMICCNCDASRQVGSAAPFQAWTARAPPSAVSCLPLIPSAFL